MSIPVQIPETLGWLKDLPGGSRWLAELPRLVEQVVETWSLVPGVPYAGSYVSLVVPVTDSKGEEAVLKLQYPHRESAGEAEALQLWGGNGAVLLLGELPEIHALLVERCSPGGHLSERSPDEALDVVVQLLPRLWISDTGGVTSLVDEVDIWIRDLPDSFEQAGRPFDSHLLDLGLSLLSELAGSQGEQVLLHQDLHGDNILSAEREPWLAIDPKPLAGEREFGVGPIVRSFELGHSREAVLRRLDRLTAELDLDRHRATGWAFAATLVWSLEAGAAFDRHIETAGWLAERLL